MKLTDFIKDKNWSEPWFKILSKNDSGEAQSHVAGIVIPKILWNLFPALDNDFSEESPTSDIMIDFQLYHEQNKLADSKVRYQSQTWRGKRTPENRLTSGLPPIRNISKEDDIFILQKSLERTLYRAILVSKSSESYQTLIKATKEKRYGQLLLEEETDVTEARIRPSSRIIKSIGSELIKDKSAAIVEMVKNSYDANSSKVTISFEEIKIDNERQVVIHVDDDGHGMSFETIINKWLVAATSDKLKRKYSPEPNKRLLQGRKGLGRFATAALGDELKLDSYEVNGQKVSLSLNWSDFENYEFLDEVPIPVISSDNINDKCGTFLEISSDEEDLLRWDEQEIEDLIKELKKLMPPYSIEDDSFQIELIFKDFPVDKYTNQIIPIEPFPITDLYDYRIFGEVSKEGNYDLTFEYQNSSGNVSEYITPKITPNEVSCGKIKIDLRVFDREGESIDDLISRGNNSEIKNFDLGKREIKNFLNTHCGVSVFRDQFRIRPYGDENNDWLELDKSRVNNPSLNIGSKQIIGWVFIEPEEQSGLEEKSARDGLKENDNYFALKAHLEIVLSELQSRRKYYRVKTGRGRKNKKAAEIIDPIADFSIVKRELKQTFKRLNISEIDSAPIFEKIEEKEQEANAAIEEIHQLIAVYQGEVTLGKVVEVIIHEARKPLSFFVNLPQIITGLGKKLQKSWDDDLFLRIIDRLDNSKTHSTALKQLFEKIDPLAKRRNPKKENVNIKAVCKDVISAFETQLNKYNIKVNLNIDKDSTIFCWQQDFYICLTNLIENSIYWLVKGETENPEITIDVHVKESIEIDFKDNGCGIDEKFIKENSIFEPGFSTKPQNENGTGLGLAIAGEAMDRNNFNLLTISSQKGAIFRITERVTNNE